MDYSSKDEHQDMFPTFRKLNSFLIHFFSSRGRFWPRYIFYFILFVIAVNLFLSSFFEYGGDSMAPLFDLLSLFMIIIFAFLYKRIEDQVVQGGKAITSLFYLIFYSVLLIGLTTPIAIFLIEWYKGARIHLPIITTFFFLIGGGEEHTFFAYVLLIAGIILGRSLVYRRHSSILRDSSLRSE